MGWVHIVNENERQRGEKGRERKKEGERVKERKKERG